MSESRTTIGEHSAPPLRWKRGAVPVIGLIGGVGSGKSAAAAAFASLGAVVIDADAAGHDALRRIEEVRRVVARFGDEVLEPAGVIDRKALARIVFADPTALRDLEAIVHPAMFESFERAILDAERRGEARMVVLDAAILLEAGWDRACDLVVFVEAPKSARVERVRVGRGWSAEELEKRESAQWPLDRKKARADHVLLNDGDAVALRSNVGRLVALIESSSPPVVSAPPGARRDP